MKARTRSAKKSGPESGGPPAGAVKPVVEQVASISSERPAAGQRTTRRILIGILVAGLAIRLIHLWAISTTAFVRIPLVATNSDLYANWQWAQAILAGDLLGRDTYHPYFEWMREIAPLETWHRWWGGEEVFQQAPLYPYLVAGLLAISGNSLNFVMFAQLLLGAAQPLVMFWLARRVFDDRVGLAAAAVTALYGPFIFHQGTLLRDWLPPVIEPLALVVLLRARDSGRVIDGLLAGTLIGLSTLTKENALLLLPMAILWLAWERRYDLWRAGALAAVLTLGFLAALSPLLARNYVVGAPLFALSNRAAEGFIQGNAADTFPVGLHHPLSMAGILARADGSFATVVRETFRTHRGNWLGFVRIQLQKLRGLADPLEVPNNVGLAYGVEISPILRFTFRYGAIFPLGLAGLLLTWKAWRRHLLLILYGVATVAGMMVAIILARYRLTIVPVLIVYAGAGLVWLFDAVRSRQRVRLLTFVGVVTGLAVLQHLILPFWHLRDMTYYALHHSTYFFSAQIYAAEGRPDRAVAEMERLRDRIERRPAFARAAYEMTLHEANYRAQWAEQLIAKGEVEAARRQAELAEAAFANHLTLSSPYFILGSLYLKLNEPAKARAFLERFLEYEPSGPRAAAVRELLAGQR
jgi:4-amino-4-deoxy-L-arabinose transferase-like glycosyltransferase